VIACFRAIATVAAKVCVACEASGRIEESAFMKESPKMNVRRRDLLSLVLANAGTAISSSMMSGPATAKPVDLKEKRKTRYQPNSAEVRNFYRVNSYPVR
jgi:hypothetical protein